jgi:hypothetical protein
VAAARSSEQCQCEENIASVKRASVGIRLIGKVKENFCPRLNRENPGIRLSGHAEVKRTFAKAKNLIEKTQFG